MRRTRPSTATATTTRCRARRWTTPPARPRRPVSSIPDLYQLWRLFRTDPAAQLVWQTARICPPMLRITNSEADRQRVVQRELELNEVLREVCAGWDRCRFDGGRTYGFQFTRAMVSRLDYFHPSLFGQATLAAETWRVSWWGS
jgi:hypothetical protein